MNITEFVECTDTEGHRFGWYVECFWCKNCGVTREDVKECAVQNHKFEHCPETGKYFCVRCGRTKVLKPVNNIEWDIIFLLLTKRKCFLFSMACLCKNLPKNISSFVEIQKYLHKISSPILPREVPLNCGLAQAHVTKWEAEIGADERIDIVADAQVFVEGKSDFSLSDNSVTVSIDEREEEEMIFVAIPQACFSNLENDGDGLVMWYPDVVSLVEIVLERMQAVGKVNLQIAKDIAVNTFNHLVAKEKEEKECKCDTRIYSQFLDIYIMVDVMLTREKKKSPHLRTSLLTTFQTIRGNVAFNQFTHRNILKNITDYLPEVKDTIPHISCDRYLIPDGYQH